MKRAKLLPSSQVPVHVALVDDHKMLRDFVAGYINSLPDCRVVLSCDSGEELLEGIDNLPELPHVCIIDISMPGINGYKVQECIKNRWPQIKSLALSIFDDSDCIFEMIRNGANGFVSKQSGPEIFHEAIQTVMSGNNYYKQCM